ncbi:hypothetical protein M9Y10_044423 [Tritrichomonas musculus]|uniref:Uncharacterized protein n=1 Tax=Tritrichomonas musculus TaxID=1915356 RepID=A0ABR2JSP9_9EUKA
MSNHFPFFYKKLKKLPKISNGTRFYSADTANPNSTLFIARSQYYDTLIHQLPEGFISIYHTQFSERIYSASVLDTQRWYLITILRFNDGIEMRPSYRSIFIAVPNFKLGSPFISYNTNITKLQDSHKQSGVAQTDKNDQDTEKVFLNSVIYPVSSRTYFPQYVSWTCFNSSLFMFTIFDNKIHTLEITYDKSTVTYKITPRTTTKGYSFRSVISSNIPHVYSIHSSTQNVHPSTNRPPFLSPGNININKINNSCVSPFLIDKTRTDIPIKFKLPDEIKIDPNTEFHIFISPQRRSIEPPLSEDRCAIFANLNEISIVFPSSGFFIKIPYKYDIEEYKILAKKYNPNIIINENARINKRGSSCYKSVHDYVGYTQEEAYYRPASRIPLYLFENGLLLIAVPRGFITAVLIDQDDRIRASFMVTVFDQKSIDSDQNEISNNRIIENSNNNNSNNDNNNYTNNQINNEDSNLEKLYNVFSLNDKASRVLCETTGDIFKLTLNPSFFASRDPRFIIPLLHYFIHHKKGINFLSNSIIIKNNIDNNVIQLINEKSLQTFWNGEIFNEILLLLFNTSSICGTFGEKVCSTFAKPHFYKQWTSLFRKSEKDKDKQNNMINSKSFIVPKTPDREDYEKSRRSSINIDLSAKKVPLSPIAEENQPNSDNESNSENSIDSIEIDDLDDSEEKIKPNNYAHASTPKGPRRNSFVYPSSLPRNSSMQKTVNVGSPSQQFTSYCYDDDLDVSPKSRLSTIVSTPLFTNQSDDNYQNSISDILPIYNFRDIETKALKLALESLQINDIKAFYKVILKIINENLFFDLFKYPEQIRFPIYMQFISIKFALAKKPFHKTVKIFDRYFKENPFSSKTSKEFWSSLTLLPHGIDWPDPGFRLNAKTLPSNPKLPSKNEKQNFNTLMRQWWFLRSKKNSMVQTEISVPEDNLFNFVEQVTNKSELGFEIFQLHQNMFGLGLYQTVTMPAK